MKNWSNQPFNGTLEEAVMSIADWSSHKIGLEVEALQANDRGRKIGDHATLRPQYDSMGFAPHLGEDVECSGLGYSSQWRVVGVAQGPFIDHERGARYIQIRRENGTSRVYLPPTIPTGDSPEALAARLRAFQEFNR